MTDKELIDSNNFDALAYGVFSQAGDTDSGRAALLKAYNQYNWSDPKKAQETLEYYGQALKYKNKDQSSFGKDIESIAPVKLEDVPENPESSTSPQDRYDKWKSLNNEYLKTTDEPQYLVAKKQLLDDVNSHADASVRQINTEQRKQNVGEAGNAAIDTAVREVQGILSPVSSSVKALSGYDLDSALTKLTDPDRDGKLISQIASGLGFTAGIVAAPNKAAQSFVMGVPAVAATTKEYSDTLSKTGDIGAARQAGLYEAGAQGIQLLGEKLVFGKEALKAGLPFAKAGATQAVAQAGARILGNQAQNIQKQQNATYDNLTEGVGDAAAVGTVITGITHAPTSFASKGNSSVRAAEIDETGAPITKTVVQTVGPAKTLNVPAEEHSPDAVPDLFGTGGSPEDLIGNDILAVAADSSPTAEGAISTSGFTSEEKDALRQNGFLRTFTREDGTTYTGIDHESLMVIRDKRREAASKPKMTDPQEVIKTKPAFTTENGDEYHVTEGGKYTKAGELPHDQTVFLGESSAKDVASAIGDGEHIVLTEAGPAIERVDEDGKKTYQAVDHTNDPQEGSYPLSISTERSPNNQTIERPVQLGQRIKKVTLDKSVGAFGEKTVVQKESQYSQKLRASQFPSQMKAVGEKGIFYTPITINEVSSEVNSFVNSAGIDGAAQALTDVSVDSRLKRGIGDYLDLYFVKKIAEAASIGDQEALDTLEADYQKIAPDISAEGTQAGQTLRVGGHSMDPLKLISARHSAYEKSLVESGKQEGVDPLEIAQSDEVLEQTKKAIKNQQDAIEHHETISQEPSIEEQALDQVISSIEDPAQERLDKDLSSIDKETEELTNLVEKTGVQADRTKRKDIKTLEGAIAKDSEELTNAVNDAVKLKNITKEESQAHEEAIKTTLKEATKKANEELSKNVKEETAQREESKKYELASANKRATDAENALKKTKEQLKKLKEKHRDLIKAGKDTESIEKKASDLTEKGKKQSEKLDAAKQQVKDITTPSEEDQKTDEFFKELESGITIDTVPVGKRRAIKVKTKRSGMDVTKLFNTKTEAFKSLSGLSKVVNDLSSTVSQGLAAKGVTNERIAEIQKRLAENKKTLDKTRDRQALSPVETKKIEAAKKRLKELEDAKSKATLESRIPKNKEDSYKKYRLQRDTLKNTPKKQSEELANAKKKLRELENQKQRAEKLALKKQEAILAGIEAAKKTAEVEATLAKYKELLKDSTISGTQKRELRSRIYELENSIESNPSKKSLLFGYWVSNQVAGGFNGLLSLISGAVTVPGVSTSLIVSDAFSAIKNVVSGKLPPSKLLSLEFLKGVADKDAWIRGVSLAKIAFETGQRLQNIIPRGELSVLGKVESSRQYEKVTHDFFEAAKNLKFGSNPIDNFVTATYKLGGYATVPFMRFLAASEALVYSTTHAGFSRASAAYEYNKGKSKGVSESELQEFLYSPKQHWESAQAESANQAKALRDSGIPVAKSTEYLNAVEKYQAKAPRDVQLSAFKQAAQLVTTGPANGYVGLMTDLINLGIDRAGGDKTPLKYLGAFANAMGNLANVQLAYTPLGALDTVGPSKRTAFERNLIRSQAVAGVVLGIGAISYLRAGRQRDPGKEPFFDIIGNYSSDNGKRAAFLSRKGTKLNAFKIGDTYIPVRDTPLGLWAMGVGAAMDNIRDGKDPDALLSTIAMYSGGTMVAGSVVSAGESMKMLQGVTDIWKAVKAEYKGEQNAHVDLIRSLLNPVKGFSPGASMQRTATRFFDNPVDARKDIASAIVEGTPFLQSAYGQPALNLFGEPMKAGKDDPTLQLHRIFSIANASDLDTKWLSDNGYEVPTISNMRFSKKIKDLVSSENEKEVQDGIELDYKMKYKIYREASSDLRDTVAKYRETYGQSAHDPRIQKALESDFRKVLAYHTVKAIPLGN